MGIDVKLLTPFIDATSNVLSQFGITDIKKGKIAKKDKLKSDHPVTVVVGIVGDIRGNVTYNLPLETAKNLASTMMMGMEVAELDDMAKSAISELSNMITGNASAMFGAIGKNTDISPPTLITGSNIIAWISQVETVVIELLTSVGSIEINIGLEV